MAFKRASGGNRGSFRFAISSLAIAIGDMLVFDRANNVVVKATSSTSQEDLAGIAMEATTTSDTSVLVELPYSLDLYIADLTNNSTAASNYERMVLTDAATVNNTGTDSTSDNAMFMQISPIGAAADKKALGRIVIPMDRA